MVKEIKNGTKGWNFQICTMNFKRVKKYILIQIYKRKFKILHKANKLLSHEFIIHF
jgi:hypothetical protein